MIELQVEGIRSADIPDLTKWKPKDRTCCYFGIELHIGPSKNSPVFDPGQMHYYQMLITTPQGILDHTAKRDAAGLKKTIVISDRALVIRSYDWPEIESAIIKRVELSRGVTLDICRYQLLRYFSWEFENFKREGQHSS
jgi:Immunity protein 8